MPDDFNAQIIDEFRANHGEVGGPFQHVQLLLVHHTGARTGTARVSPVVYLKDGDRYVIIASKAGAPDNPGWYHNLKAHPDTSIEVGDDVMDVHASEAIGPERDRLYAAMVKQAPQFGEYQANTDRVIPVVVLSPAAQS